MASQRVTFYVQLVPEWATDGSLYGVKAAKMTQRLPQEPLPGAVVVPLTLYADPALFGPVDALYLEVKPSLDGNGVTAGVSDG